MTGTNFAVLERLVRVFERMAYFGIAFAVVGTAFGVFLQGGARPTVIAGTCATGGAMVFAGVRGRLKGNRALARLHDQTSQHGEHS